MKLPDTFFMLFVCCLAASFASAESPTQPQVISTIQPGDRVAIVGNTFADQLRIHGYLESLLLQSSAHNSVSIRNLGWAGDMLTARDRPTNFPTEEATLTAHKTDVIIACFGLGESFAGQQKIGEFQTNLKAFIASHAGKKYNDKSEVRLILVSPIAHENLGELTPMREKRNSELRAYTAAMKEVASRTNVPFVDLFAPSLYLMDESKGPNLTTNGIHLNQYGYWAMSKSFAGQLVGKNLAEDQAWRLIVDIKSKTSTSRGVDISEIATVGNTLSFLVTEKSAPSLPPPTDQTLPPQLQFCRDTLRIESLSPGTYQLSVDEKPVVSATADAWAEGVAIDASPAHQEAEAFRTAINDKNLQFTYSWKALNQVHIVGERKSSRSGQALPQEVIEFNELAKKRDRELRDGVELKSRRWTIVRVEQRSEEKR